MSRTTKSSTISIVTIAIGVVLIGFAAIISFYSDHELSSATATPPLLSQDVPRITPNEAKNARDTGDAVIVDVRDFESYTAEHVQGAISIPLNELEARMDELPADKLIIPY